MSKGRQAWWVWLGVGGGGGKWCSVSLPAVKYLEFSSLGAGTSLSYSRATHLRSQLLAGPRGACRACHLCIQSSFLFLPSGEGASPLEPPKPTQTLKGEAGRTHAPPETTSLQLMFEEPGAIG